MTRNRSGNSNGTSWTPQPGEIMRPYGKGDERDKAAWNTASRGVVVYGRGARRQRYSGRPGAAFEDAGARAGGTICRALELEPNAENTGSGAPRRSGF